MTSANWMVLAMVGWIAILVDGWIIHVHWLAVIGVLIFMYLFWRFEDMIKEPEDEAFEDLEMRLKFARESTASVSIKSVEDAFDDWDHSHRPDQYFVEQKAFKAGWVAAIRNEWAKESND